MDRPNKYRTQDNPEQRWQPSPEDGYGRAHDRPGAGNAGEMVAKDDFFLCRHKIDIVAQLLAWNSCRGIKTKDLACQPAAVGVVGDDETDERGDGDKQCSHEVLPGRGSKRPTGESSFYTKRLGEVTG